MSLEFIESFDHFTTGATLPRKWDSSSTTNSNFGAGRFGGNAFDYQNSPLYLTGNQLATVATRVVGFAWKFTPTEGTSAFFQFRDGTNIQVDLRMDASHHLNVTRNGTLLGTGTTTIANATWYYLELKVTINSSAGAITLRINNIPEITLTGVNTQATSNASMDSIAFPNAGYPTWVDDIYVLNTSGAINNDFLGDSRVLAVLPTGDGATTNWSANPTGAHYANVDDPNPNDDTDYNYSSTSGQIDLYTIPASTITGTIQGVQTTMTARKDDIGLRQIREQCRSAGTTYDGSVTQTLTPNYSGYRQIREVDPATSALWTQTGINAAQFGVKVV